MGNGISLIVKGIGHIPSKKNHHFPRKDGGLLIDKKIKERMRQLENAMLSALYSKSQIIGSETHSECLSRLRMFLSKLSDDSVREIPKGSWEVEYVNPGEEGVTITIERI